jgi:hypothetical protein
MASAPERRSIDFGYTNCYRRKTKPAMVAGFEVAVSILAEGTATEGTLMTRLHFSSVIVKPQAAAQGRGNGL